MCSKHRNAIFFACGAPSMFSHCIHYNIIYIYIVFPPAAGQNCVSSACLQDACRQAENSKNVGPLQAGNVLFKKNPNFCPPQAEFF